jgi:hypothetical protein
MDTHDLASFALAGFDSPQQLTFRLIRSQNQDFILRLEQREHSLIVVLQVQKLLGINAQLRPVTSWPVRH